MRAGYLELSRLLSSLSHRIVQRGYRRHRCDGPARRMVCGARLCAPRPVGDGCGQSRGRITRQAVIPCDTPSKPRSRYVGRMQRALLQNERGKPLSPTQPSVRGSSCSGAYPRRALKASSELAGGPVHQIRRPTRETSFDIARGRRPLGHDLARYPPLRERASFHSVV